MADAVRGPASYTVPKVDVLLSTVFRSQPNVQPGITSEGVFTPGNPDGSPADPNTGSLVAVNKDGTFTVFEEGLDRPTSLEVTGKLPMGSHLPVRCGRLRTCQSLTSARPVECGQQLFRCVCPPWQGGGACCLTRYAWSMSATNH